MPSVSATHAVPAHTAPAYAPENPDTAITAPPTPRTSVLLGATAQVSSPDTFALFLPPWQYYYNCARACIRACQVWSSPGSVAPPDLKLQKCGANRLTIPKRHPRVTFMEK